MQNWKTTAIGLAGAIWIVAQPIIENGTFNFSHDWKNLVGAAISASIGYFAKDFSVSGTTTK